MTIRHLACALAALLLAGCYTVSYRTDLAGNEQYREERGDFFLFGLIGDKTVDLKALCPQGVSRWKSQQTFVDGLLGLLTIGIYIPRHVTVECSSGAAYLLEREAGGPEYRVVSTLVPHAG
jgi:hypothetical protein